MDGVGEEGLEAAAEGEGAEGEGGVGEEEEEVVGWVVWVEVEKEEGGFLWLALVGCEGGGGV